MTWHGENACIVGIGQTDFSRDSGRTELHLAVQSITAAVANAGISPKEIGGLVTYSMDNNDPAKVAQTMGLDLTWFSQVPYGGGGAAATIRDAVLAVETGAAEVVVAYRAMNERSGQRFGQPGMSYGGTGSSLYEPYGSLSPAANLALNARRYMHEFGLTNEDFAPVAVADRKHASTNPNAFFYQKPITEDDHNKSRWIIEPVYRLLDCCLESDGAVAVVVTSTGRARDLDQQPVRVLAAAQGLAGGAPGNHNYYGSHVVELRETQAAARQIWKQSGLRPDDVQAALIYDNFTDLVLRQIEVLGFCELGEGKDFIKNGNIELGGKLPINLHGGHLGEAYIHGMNGIVEGVRQIRGTAVNQVPNMEHILVTAGSAVPTSALILGRP
jgi:acetyl-CoA acetyltransferase